MLPLALYDHPCSYGLKTADPLIPNIFLTNYPRLILSVPQQQRMVVVKWERGARQATTF